MRNEFTAIFDRERPARPSEQVRQRSYIVVAPNGWDPTSVYTKESPRNRNLIQTILLKLCA